MPLAFEAHGKLVASGQQMLGRCVHSGRQHWTHPGSHCPTSVVPHWSLIGRGQDFGGAGSLHAALPGAREATETMAPAAAAAAAPQGLAPPHEEPKPLDPFGLNAPEPIWLWDDIEPEEEEACVAAEFAALFAA